MVNISHLFFKATGLMPNKEIVRTAKSIGKTLAKEYKSGDNVDIKRVKEVLREHIGSKKAAKIEVAEDFETFERYASSLGMDKEQAKLIFTGSKSSVIPSPGGKKTLLSLRISDTSTSNALNLTVHELEHALHSSISPSAVLEKLKLKIRGKKYTDKLLEKYGAIINEKCFELQQLLFYKAKFKGKDAIGGYTEYSRGKSGLLTQMGLVSEDSMKEVLCRLVQGELTNSDKKLDMKILKGLRDILKDESRAYKSGGAVERYFDETAGIVNPNANKSEMFALLYDETNKTVRKEIRKLRKERIKSFFSLSVKKGKLFGIETIQNPDDSTTTFIVKNGKKRKVIESEITESDVPDSVKEGLGILLH